MTVIQLMNRIKYKDYLVISTEGRNLFDLLSFT